MTVLRRTKNKTIVRVAPKKGYTRATRRHYRHHNQARPSGYRGRDY